MLFLSLFTAQSPVFSKNQSPAQHNTFDGLPPGSRSLGMGYAYSTVGGDVSSVYYNPAALAFNPDGTLCFSYEISRQSALTSDQILQGDALKTRTLVFVGINSSQGAFSWRPVANDVSHTVAGADFTDTTTKINAYTFSVTNKQEKVYTGLNVTYLSGRIGQAILKSGVPSTIISDGNGITLDFGTIYKVSDQFSVGFNLKNLCGFMWWDDYETDLLPFTMISGFSFNISRFTIFSTDWEKRYYRKNDVPAMELTHFGFEQRISNILSAQFGMYGQDLNDKTKSNYTCGISYEQGAYKLSLSGEKYQVSATDVYRYMFGFIIPLK